MTTFNAYYQSELAFMRESGRSFATAYPDAAKYLAEPGADPDVERLLEGVAFLTGRIRQRLDDGLPEVTHALIAALLPHYLRPLPAMTVVQFSSSALRRDAVVVPAGAFIDAVALAGTACRFRTVHAVTVTPLSITQVRSEPGPPTRVAVTFSLPEGAVTTGLHRVRLFLGEDAPAARALHLCLSRNAGVSLLIEGRPVPARLTLAAVGFAAEEALLPHPPTASESHRLLVEWFAFPQRFQALELEGLDAALPPGTTSFTISVECTTHGRLLPALGPASLLLHTTPAVNLFPGEAEPLTIDGRSTVHRVRPAGGDPQHLGIFSVTGVTGRVHGSTRDIPLERRWHRQASSTATWLERRRPAVLGSGADVDLLLDNAPRADGPLTLSLTVLCTNRDLPTRLGSGDVRRPGPGVPAGLTVRNLLVPSPAVEPALSGDLHWRLLGHLALDRSSLLSVEGLREAFALYDLRAPLDQTARHAHQRLSEALLDVTTERGIRLLDGVPIRGVVITISVDEERLGGLGEAHLLGTVLDGFLSSAVSLNAFTRLSLRCTRAGEVFTWADRLGRKRLL